jgi:hypothetical protein
MRNILGVVHASAASYRREWALKTGKAEKDVYVPRGLRGNN